MWINWRGFLPRSRARAGPALPICQLPSGCRRTQGVQCLARREPVGGQAMNRRKFLVGTGVTLGTSTLAGWLQGASFSAAAELSKAATGLDSWPAVREQFNLSPSVINMAGFFFASHPKPVRD